MIVSSPTGPSPVPSSPPTATTTCRPSQALKTCVAVSPNWISVKSPQMPARPSTTFYATSTTTWAHSVSFPCVSMRSTKTLQPVSLAAMMPRARLSAPMATPSPSTAMTINATTASGSVVNAVVTNYYPISALHLTPRIRQYLVPSVTRSIRLVIRCALHALSPMATYA